MRVREIRDYYVYIMTNRSYTVLYTGMTNNLPYRVSQHKKEPSGFAKQYRTTLLVYYDTTTDVWGALQREKQIKNMHRADKIRLIESMNPSWVDLSEALIPPTLPDPVCGQGDNTGARGAPLHLWT